MSNIFGAIVLILILFWAALPHPKDDTDPENGRSGLKLLTDAKTGCQYLGNRTFGITPRLDGAGKHVGCGQ